LWAQPIRAPAARQRAGKAERRVQILEYKSGLCRRITNGIEHGLGLGVDRRSGLDSLAFPVENGVELIDDCVMKTRTSRITLFLSVGAVSLVAIGAAAQTSEPTTTTTTTTTALSSDAPPAKLPYGVDDVLKLSRAQISEDITLNYVRNSGTIYNLAPKDIVYLRNEGVSDKVISTMLDQRKSVPAEVAAQNAVQAQTAGTVTVQSFAVPATRSVQAAPVYVAPPPVVVQPVPVYVEPEPEYVPPSTVYVIPYGSSGCTYYRYPPYYYGGSYGGPSTVVTIGGGYFGGPRYYSASRHGGGHCSSVYHLGRR